MSSNYRVLARHYRPSRLSELIGQESLVKTLGNALRSGRIAHAFLLAGIRGVGKTTTARILARGLNCVGPDGSGGPTGEPCGSCAPCAAMSTGNPIDVIEMDAATRTGIDDIREIVDSVRYAPVGSRYKVYIVDEVHMLSEKAFNGLLKTLEEPPPHAKFVFATTEVRKIPITVLSRCQRYDLRRVEIATLTTYLQKLCGIEEVRLEEPAIQLIASAADGSVRDSLSLLDQAIVLGDGAVTTAQVQEMLGVGDKHRVFELYRAVIQGDAAGALDRFGQLWSLGIDPPALFQDLLSYAHMSSRLRLGLAPGDGALLLGADLGDAMAELAKAASVGRLSRVWQVLLRGLDEIRAASDMVSAVEMILMRACLVSELPSPGELARLVRDGLPATEAGEPSSRPAPPARAAPAAPSPPTRLRVVHPAPADPAPAAEADPPALAPAYESFAELVADLRRHGDGALAGMLHGAARLVHLEPGRIELALGPGLPGDLLARLGKALQIRTGRHWVVTRSDGAGQPTLAEHAQLQKRERIEHLAKDPEVKRLLDAFPGAKIVDVRNTDTVDPEVKRSNLA